MHLYIYTIIHLYIYTFIHLYIYTCIHLYIYTFIQSCIWEEKESIYVACAVSWGAGPRGWQSAVRPQAPWCRWKRGRCVALGIYRAGRHGLYTIIVSHQRHQTQLCMIAMMSYSQTLGGSKGVALTFRRIEIFGSLRLDVGIGVGVNACADQYGSVNAILGPAAWECTLVAQPCVVIILDDHIRRDGDCRWHLHALYTLFSPTCRQKPNPFLSRLASHVSIQLHTHTQFDGFQTSDGVNQQFTFSFFLKVVPRYDMKILRLDVSPLCRRMRIVSKL